MSALNRIKIRVLKKDTFLVLLGLLLSTIMLGYAPSSILLGLFVGCSIINFIFNPIKVEFNINLVLTIVLYVLFVITLFWSVDIALTVKGLGRMLALILVPISFILLPPFTKKDVNYIFEFFTKSNVLYCLLFLIVAFYKFIKTSDILVFTYHELVSVLKLHAVYVSAYFLISYIYLLQKQRKNKFDFFSALLLFTGIILLSSKVIILCLILVTLIYYLFFKSFNKAIKKNRVIIIPFLIIIIMSSQYVVNRVVFERNSNIEEVLTIKKVDHIYPWTGTTIRLLQLRFLSDQIKEDNILIKGYGLFASSKNLKERHLEFNTYPGYHYYNYHNMYAQVLSELGLSGLILLLVILGLNIYQSIKKKSYLFLCFSLITIIWFFSESVLWVQRGLFFFVIFHSIFNRMTFFKFRENSTKK